VEGLAALSTLGLLRLEKSYWLRLQDRWTQASVRAVERLKKLRPDLQVNFRHDSHGTSFRLNWWG
jgi:hypothetical protein